MSIGCWKGHLSKVKNILTLEMSKRKYSALAIVQIPIAIYSFLKARYGWLNVKYFHQKKNSFLTTRSWGWYVGSIWCHNVMFMMSSWHVYDVIIMEDLLQNLDFLMMIYCCWFCPWNLRHFVVLALVVHDILSTVQLVSARLFYFPQWINVLFISRER